VRYYSSQCAKCKNAYGRKYHAKNRKRDLKRGRVWYQRNRESILATGRARPARDYHAKKLRGYGIDVDGYEKMLERQGQVCAICRQPPKGKRVERLSVDHDHETRKVRGLLCRRCNAALGLCHDSIEWLQKAISYLRKERH